METLQKKISQILNKPSDSVEVQEYMSIFQKRTPCSIDEHDVGFDPVSMYVKCFKCGRKVSQSAVIDQGPGVLVKAYGPKTAQRLMNPSTQPIHSGIGKMDSKTRAEYHEWYITSMIRNRLRNT